MGISSILEEETLNFISLQYRVLFSNTINNIFKNNIAFANVCLVRFIFCG